MRTLKGYLEKRKILYLSLFFYPTFIFSFEHNKYNFLEENNSFYLKGFIDFKSTDLPINIFEKDWENIPSHSKENEAFGEVYLDIHKNYKSLRFGIFSEKNAYLNINDGFLQTCYYAGQNFNYLLNKPSISQEISALTINGEANYYSSYGVYLQAIKNYKNHFFSLKTKLHNASDLHHISANGYNSDKFKLAVDYYYAKKNILTKNKLHDNSTQGLGYSFDLEYINKSSKHFLYLGVLNINSYIHWSSITKMNYDFDSQTTFIGEDGYKHTKPFGIGKYNFDTKFKQKIPTYYKSSFEYKPLNNYYVGINTNGYKDTFFNELFLKKQIDKNIYKLGYIKENENLLFGTYLNELSFFNHKIDKIAFEASNKIGYSNTIILASFNIKF